MSENCPDYSSALERICIETIGPDAAQVDEHGAFPERGLSTLATAGLMGAVSAPEVGGLGLGHRGAAAIVARLAQECGSTAMVTCMHYCGTAALEAFAPRDVRAAAARGTHLSTLAFSEAGSRSPFGLPSALPRARAEHTKLRDGYHRVIQLTRAMDEGRRRRLLRLGFHEPEAGELSALYTGNFM